MFKKLFGSLRGGGNSQVFGGFTFDQKRRATRRTCDVRVDGTLGRTIFSATVVDMSAAGLRLVLDDPMKIKPNATLKISCPDSGDVPPVECLARWTRTRESDSSLFVGLEFKDPKALGKSWVKTQMQQIGFRPHNIREQRKEQRVECRLPAMLEMGGQIVHCVIRNMSLNGVLLESPKPVRAGAEIQVKVTEHSAFPATTLTGVVRHQQHPDPSAPFGYGLILRDLSSTQLDAIKGFMRHRHNAAWEQLARDYLYEEKEAEAQATEDVEIPDLASIMDETEE